MAPPSPWMENLSCESDCGTGSLSFTLAWAIPFCHASIEHPGPVGELVLGVVVAAAPTDNLHVLWIRLPIT